MFRSILIMILLGGPAVAQEKLCGEDAPCEVAGGTYHLVAPEDWDGETPLPALIFFHGHRGSGAQVFRSAGLKEDFSDHGYLLIAPDGAIREGTDYRAWPAREGAARDDVAFTLAVIDDVARLLPLDRDRVYASGFSAGGSMAWLLACRAGDRLAGMVSVAGALRRPNPYQCPGLPLPVMQIHGWTDGQVPLEGRGIGDWHQGSVWETLEIARQAAGCRSNPDEITVGERFRSRDWDVSCESGAPIRLAMHDGGHGLPPGWTQMAREFFEGQ